ncbi:UNC93-like protein MFSD11 isoform X2 [Leptinotarsa decemlineata]|uniref:UNC93-like protein MFSD11 isoform X2 n=1 Tax=Leptinotarsa decemlineata TaxID=7539 RepID=UPI003D307D7C
MMLMMMTKPSQAIKQNKQERKKTILSSITSEDPTFTGNAYYSLAIIYVVFSIFNWAAPSVISVIGPKFSMVLGGCAYLLFIVSFIIPKTWLLYLVSTIIGIGAAMIWTGQGNYLTLNSTKRHISRNSGVFWAMLQLSMFIGNLFVYFAFKGKDKIDKSTRTVVIWTLSAVAVCGVFVLLILPRATKESEDDDEDAVEEVPEGPIAAFFGAVRLFMTKDMQLLSITFLYTGLELGFFSGVYSSCIGFTQAFENRKELVGISGLFIGVGEVLGGALFGILGSKTTKWGRDPIVGGAFIIHAVSYFLIFLNLPNSSPFNDTNESAYMTSNAILAIFCSFLLGFGDSCYNTQIYSLLGSVYADKSAPAFAIFKFTQSVGAAVCFFYADSLVLYGQLAILLVFGTLGTISFIWVEWTAKKQNTLKRSEDEKGSAANLT